MVRSLLVAAILLLSPQMALAHALGAECKVRGQRVELEAYFSDNSPAQDAKVVVRDEAKTALAEGKTDGEGHWTFPIPPAGRYEVVVEAGGGHRTTVVLTVPERDLSGAVIEHYDSASAGLRREEFTQTPWSRVGLGIALIALSAAVLFLALRKSRSTGERKT